MKTPQDRPRLFGENRPKLLLDTNAIRYCMTDPCKAPGGSAFSEADLSTLRARILELAEADDLRIIFSLPLLWELTNVNRDHGLDVFVEMLRFYATASRRWAIRHEHERMRLEIVTGRKLRDDEVFEVCDVEDTLRKAANGETVKRVFDMQFGLKKKESETEIEKRLDVTRELTKNSSEWKKDLAEAPEKVWEQFVKDNTKAAVRKYARANRLRLPRHRCPKYRDLPTFWFHEAFYWSKVKRVFIETKKSLTSKNSVQEMPDILDVTHFCDAAYADILVTQDAGFAHVAQTARVPLRVMSFVSFAKTILQA